MPEHNAKSYENWEEIILDCYVSPVQPKEEEENALPVEEIARCEDYEHGEAHRTSDEKEARKTWPSR